MKNNLDLMIKLFSDFGIDINNNQAELFYKYYELLIEWNSKINLTAITEYEDVIVKHFIDSVSLSKHYDLNSVESIIDVGTGAGFPGIPLKILFPHLKVTLLDTLNKRIIFLNKVIDELNLQSIETIHGRAEDVSHETEYREKYDICISRAVANLSSLMELCTPFVKNNGFFISYKSEKSNEELQLASNAFVLLNCVLDNQKEFLINGNKRSLLFIRKTDFTPKKYPRKAGTPVKNPL